MQRPLVPACAFWLAMTTVGAAAVSQETLPPDCGARAEAACAAAPSLGAVSLHRGEPGGTIAAALQVAAAELLGPPGAATAPLGGAAQRRAAGVEEDAAAAAPPPPRCGEAAAAAAAGGPGQQPAPAGGVGAAPPSGAKRWCGTSYDVSKRRWRASLRDGGRTRNLGCYRTEEEAARAYDAAVRARGGGRAVTVNFPDASRGETLAVRNVGQKTAAAFARRRLG